MAGTKDVIAYICRKYPQAAELGLLRVLYMVYLADWRHVLAHGQQLMDVTWQSGELGPEASPVLATLLTDPHVRRVASASADGTPVERVQVDEGYMPQVTTEEAGTLDFVIGLAKVRRPAELKRLVYSTYPMFTQPKFEDLDLISLADAYRHGSDRDAAVLA